MLQKPILIRQDSLNGKWNNAYKNYKLFTIYKDSLDNEETKKNTIQANITYQFEKKAALVKADQKKKDELSKSELKKQQITKYFVSIILALVLLFTLFLLNRFLLIKNKKLII